MLTLYCCSVFHTRKDPQALLSSTAWFPSTVLKHGTFRRRSPTQQPRCTFSNPASQVHLLKHNMARLPHPSRRQAHGSPGQMFNTARQHNSLAQPSNSSLTQLSSTAFRHDGTAASDSSAAVRAFAGAVAVVDDASGLDEHEHLFLGVGVVPHAHVDPAGWRRRVVVRNLVWHEMKFKDWISC